MIAIDTHVHYWDLDRHRYGWIDPASWLAGPWYPNHFTEATRSEQSTMATDLAGHIFVEAGAAPEHAVSEARWVSSLRRQNEAIRGIVAGWRVGGGAGLIEELTAIDGVVGVRIGLGTDELLPMIIADVALLAAAGLTIDLLGRPSQLRQVRAIASAAPDATLVLDHCFKPRIQAGVRDVPVSGDWDKGIAALAACDRVVCKFSGLGTDVLKADGELEDDWSTSDLLPTFEHVMQVFGSKRVIYGGDWPVLLRSGSYDRWLRVVADLVHRLSTDEQVAFWNRNAIGTYCLEAR